VQGGPWVDVGDIGLRHDIQILSDAGLITGPVTSWPLSWGSIQSDLANSVELSDFEAAALSRVRRAAGIATRDEIIELHSRVSVAENPIELRSFANTPREDQEIEVGAAWTGKRFAFRAQGTWVDDPLDTKEWRADGSYAGFALGNWMLAASMQDRWWGPGWQGSMILSNNARPIPSLTLERNSTLPYESKWLSWIGPWDFTFLLGRLNDTDSVEDGNFMGMRFNFKPFDSLEIGLSRTAQFCGTEIIRDPETGSEEGKQSRPCSLSTFWKLLKGQDNAGENVNSSNEPGNQLAGYDLRWSGSLFSQPLAFYTHWIGEDANALLPTQMAGQFGLENWGQLGNLGSYRVFFEWADTECDFDFYRGNGGTPNCTYNNNPIFKDGYRYRGRSIAHTFDNDSSIFSLGGILIDHNDAVWSLKANAGNLNYDDRGQRTPEQVRNTVAKEKTKYRELAVSYTQTIGFGKIGLGAGYDAREIVRTGVNNNEFRLYLEWTVTNFN
jgi:hypothetical protein